MSTKRTALITGGANGIGAAVASALAEQGHDIVVFDRDPAACAASAVALKAKGAHRVITREVDVCNADSVGEALRSTLAETGRVDVLVNAVGGSTPQVPVEDVKLEDWDASLTLNLRGLFLCTRAVVPGMKQGKWGRIVNLSSVAGRTRSLFGGVQYTAAKAAVIGFSRQCAFELAPFGITVNVVAPGVTLSERVQQRWEQRSQADRDMIEGLIPVGRAATVEEPAAAVVFLCSEGASYTTGAVIDVNGGLYIG